MWESAYHLSWTVQRSTEAVSVMPVKAGKLKMDI